MLPSSAARNAVGVVRPAAPKDAKQFGFGSSQLYSKYGGAPQARPADPSKVKFTEINDILNDKVSVQQLVNIRGVVKDVQVPMKSGGTDWKTTFRLADEGSEASHSAIQVNAFAAEKDMVTLNAYDFVFLLDAKVQTYGGGRSLISNFKSCAYVYPHSIISKEEFVPSGTRTVWKFKHGVSQEPIKDEPMTTEAREVYKRIAATTEANGTNVDAEVVTIQMGTALSANVHDKRCLLQDVADHKFYDLLVRIVTEPRSSGDAATFWATDYTVNESFPDKGRSGFFADFEQSANGKNTKTGTVGDECGYLDKYTAGKGKRGAADAAADAKWPGPLGRRSIFLSCYQEHKTAIMDYATVGSWVKLANVNVRYGRNSGFLEGFQNAETREFSSRVHVDVLDEDLDVETMEPRHLEAMKRQHAYEKSRKKYIKETTKRVQKQQASRKRLAESGTENSKQRRQRMRMEKQKDGGGDDGGDDEMLGMPANRAISCEGHNQPITPFSDVFRPELYRNPDKKDEHYPFVNVKFAAKVRVVDFMPNRLQDFAVSRYIGQLEQTGYVGDGDSSSSDDDDEASNFASGFGPQAAVVKRSSTDKLIWEWRFAFLLEDASEDALTHEENGAPKSQIWAVVNNAQGQALLDMDACDLKNNAGDVEHLRQKMFLLWGNLEEIKCEKQRRAVAAKARARESEQAAAEAARRAAQREQQQIQKQKQHAEAAKKAREAQAAQKAQMELKRQAATKAGQKNYNPPPSSSDDEADDSTPSRKKASHADKPSTEPAAEVEAEPEAEVPAPEEPLPAVSNRPFVCCIRQYGIQEKVKPPPRNDDDMDVDSDDEEVKREWRQMFDLFGTKIRA